VCSDTACAACAGIAHVCRPVSSEHTPLWQQQDSAAAADPQDGPAGTWGRQGPEHKLGQDTMSEDERYGTHTDEHASTLAGVILMQQRQD
jgi:hypothetical protein